MIAVTILSFGISIGLFVLSAVFKVAGKARLALPVLYILVAAVSTLFTDWTTKHETLVFIGLFILIGLVVLSWIISLVGVIRRKKHDRFIEDDVTWQIHRARELGVPLDSVTFDENGNLIDPRTGEPVVFGPGVKFY